MNIAVVISTYDRVDDAKINQELIRTEWTKNSQIKAIKIVHSYNGKAEWYPNKYLEDFLVTAQNPGHFQGASELLDCGFAEIVNQKWDVDFVVFLAADTWLINADYVVKIISDMRKNQLYIATSPWDGLPDKAGNIMHGFATDFFIIDYSWFKESNVFPINYKQFSDRYSEIYYYQGGIISVERLFASRFLRSIHLQIKSDVEFVAFAKSKVRVMSERDPVHEKIDTNGQWIRKMYWPELGLITHHKTEKKQIILKELNLRAGENIIKLVESSDLTYFNSSLTSNQTIN